MSDHNQNNGPETDFSNLTNLEAKKLLDAYATEEKLLELELKREAVANMKQDRARKAIKDELENEEYSKLMSKRQEKLDDAKAKGQQVRSMIASRERLQKICTHKKGGRGPGAVMNGQGQDDQFAIIKHVLPSGRYFILCQRCGGEWVSRDPLTGEAGSADFEKMNSVPTDNTISGSTLFLPTRVIN